MYSFRSISISFLIICASGSFAQDTWENPNETVTGEELYPVCTFCHGDSVQGNDRRDGPALAGLEAWYIERQLNNFKNCIRGYLDEDVTGHVMHDATPMLRNDFTTKSISEYIAGLEPGKPMAANAIGPRPFLWDSPYGGLDPSIVGNAEAGKAMYSSVCVICHAADGSGSEALGAPSLVYQSEKYMARQLMYFRDGIRGAHPKDTAGQQMAAMSQMLTSDQSIADVLAYISEL